MEAATTQAIEGLSQRWNEPEIASASLLHWSSELGRLIWPRTLKQWCLETSYRLMAAAKTRAA